MPPLRPDLSAFRSLWRPHLLVFAACALSLGVAACDAGEPDAPAEPVAPVEIATTAVAAPTDTSAGTGDDMAERELSPKAYFSGDEAPPPPGWLAARSAEQASAIGATDLRADFRLTDGLAESGIAWQHRTTPDGAKVFKPNHYDHGNGIAAADVDGDGLTDLYFVSQIGANGLMRGLGEGRFEDVTEQAGVAVDDAVSVSASFADVDNDGDPDLYVTTIKEGNRLFLNDGSGVFRDASAESGADYLGHPSAADFFDYDQDGLLDLYVSVVGIYTTADKAPAAADTNDPADPQDYEYWVGLEDAFAGHTFRDRTESGRLFHNVGDGRFEDVTDAMGLADERAWNGDTLPVDINQDGWTDLYLLNMQGNDEYYENQQGTGFTKRSREVFNNTSWGAMGGEVLDWNGDGAQDLFVTDMHSDMIEDLAPQYDKSKARPMWPEATFLTGGISILGNSFFEAGDDGYTEISDENGAEMFWPWGLSTGDINADGWDDALISAGMGFTFRYGPNSLLLNDGGERFVDAEFVVGLEPRPSGTFFQPWFAVDCDGADAELSHCADKTGVVQFWEAHSSRATLMLDLEEDGDLDVVMGEWNTSPMILRNNLDERGGLHSVTVELEGTSANRDALGAVVRVRAGGRDQVKVNDGQSGYLAQSDLPLYFGLGDASDVERVEVTWPGGATQVVEGPFAAGTTLEIVQE